MVTTTLNDSRFENRIQSFLNIIPDNFYFTKFVYNIDNVYMEMKIKKTYDLN